MTAPHDLDRLLDAFLADGPGELPDPSFDAVRDRTESTRQRVVIGPWRVPDMNKFLALGAGIAAVVVVLAVGSRLLPAPAGSLAGAASRPSPTAAPSLTRSPTPSPSTSPAPATPPPLNQTFTSAVHGISMSYPETWDVRAATEPWIVRPGVRPPQFLDPGIDMLSARYIDELFMAIYSQPLGDSTPEEWFAAQIADNRCSTTEPISVDGTTGRIGADCRFAFVTTAGRGYVIQLYRGGDDFSQDPSAPYDRAWFEQVLATVQLHPEDAVDVAPSATP
jgi:hypothetical protein